MRQMARAGKDALDADFFGRRCRNVPYNAAYTPQNPAQKFYDRYTAYCYSANYRRILHFLLEITLRKC